MPNLQLAIGEKQPFWDANGNPLTGGKLFVYSAGTTTKVTSYQETTGTTANTNPIILNGRGEVPAGLYVVSGLYKLVLAPSTDTDPPSSPIWTRDNLTAINDVLQAQSEWAAFGGNPTWLSTTTFSVTGDQTTTFLVRRRFRIVDSGGTKYGFISASSFSAGVTTVTVVLDTGVLANPITSVDVGVLSPTNISIPNLTDAQFFITGSADVTKLTRFEVDTNVTTATTRVLTVPSADGTLAYTDRTDGGLPQIVAPSITASVAANALTLTCGLLSLDFRSTTLTSGAMTRVTGTPANLVISSGSTLGATNAVQARIVILALNNAGTIELAAINIANAVVTLAENNLVSTTAEGGAGGADSANTAYSTTARTNVAYRVIGYIDSTQATAGTYATTPSLVQSFGGNVLNGMSGLGWGQVWTDVSGSRSSGTTYYNTTGRPIQLSIQASVSATPWSVQIAVGGTVVALWAYSTITGTGINQATQAIVPVGSLYVVTYSSVTVVWLELR